MAENQPLVTVLMPVYNASAFLSEAIESILQQTYTNFEFLIIDDGSTDNSADIINSYADPRIRLIQNPSNLQLIATLNKGISLSQSTYIARMDADDIAFPERLEKQVAFMEANHEVGLLGTAFESFGNKNAIVRYATDHHTIRWKQLYECHILHPSVMLRKSILDEIHHLFDESFKHAEDYELWGRLSQVTKFANLPDVLMRYRQSDGNITHRFVEVQNRNSDRVKKFLFQQLGVADISETELSIFRGTAYHQYHKGIDYLNSLANLLERMWNANDKSKYFPHTFLAEKLGHMWFHACTNNSGLGWQAYKRYTRSGISKLANFGSLQLAKFQIKALIKKGS